MQFDWKRFMNRNYPIAVHCRTEKEAEDFCREMHEHGLTWCNKGSYLKCNEYNTYKEETCYTNEGMFADRNFYIRNGYEILEWSDYIDSIYIMTYNPDSSTWYNAMVY